MNISTPSKTKCVFAKLKHNDAEENLLPSVRRMAPRRKGMSTSKDLRGFDIFHTPVYVINLKERTDRWEQFVEQDPGVRALHLHKFQATNGKALDFLKDPRIAPYARLNIMRNDRRTHREVATLGAIGASISHARVWRKLVDSGAPYAVIMEDDARFTMEQLQTINEVAKTIPSSTQIWLLGLYKPNMIREPLPNGSPWSRVYQFTAIHAYVLTRAAAQKLLEQIYPIDTHVDHYLSIMSVLYDIPMLIHEDVHIPFGGVMESGNKARALEIMGGVK
jgi:GR25 family glycosyltransferase involved in LPS biosynthesis